MLTATNANDIFNACIEKYHIIDNVNQAKENPYPQDTMDFLLFNKCWIDTVQWHYEDLIRVPDIDPAEGMELKRLIDASNQRRTDMVEVLDDWFIEQFKEVEPASDATVNSESPAWIIDRLSILALKIYHMKEQASRTNVDEQHKISAKCQISCFGRAANRLVY
jgi:hypothetical protein